MKLRLLIMIGALLVLGAGPTLAQNTGIVTLDTTVGEFSDGQYLATGEEITFFIRLTNDVGLDISGITNGFRVYSEDGAQWTTAAGDNSHDPTLAGLFDLVWYINHLGITGMDSDTVGFAGAVMNFDGMPVDYDGVPYSITIGPIDVSHAGKHLCLDSCYYPPSGDWKWADIGAGLEFPTWDGPHCWVITDPGDVHRDNAAALPISFSLSQNYPNPFNPSTQVKFDLPQRSEVDLTVYNVLGQEVTTLVHETMAAGSYTADWDGTSRTGSPVASGVYFYRLSAGDFTETKKMMLLK